MIELGLYREVLDCSEWIASRWLDDIEASADRMRRAVEYIRELIEQPKEMEARLIDEYLHG